MDLLLQKIMQDKEKSVTEGNWDLLDVTSLCPLFMKFSPLANTEWPIMVVMWELGPLTAKSIAELLQRKGLDIDLYAVKTYLARMVKKELVESTRFGRAYVYRPTVEPTELVNDEVSRLWSHVPRQLRIDAFRECIAEISKDLPEETIKALEDVLDSATSEES
ncbi:MAG: BlaI/MecI/CopY family transcriptional regulator [Verrucomicrobiota bacterium]